MSEDMTYCLANCKNMATCYRNPKRIKQHDIPHSYSDFSKVCMGYEQVGEVKKNDEIQNR